MIDYSDLIERLRAWDGCWPASGLERNVAEAANVIEAQAKRIAKLEAALMPFSIIWLYPDDLGLEQANNIRSDEDWNEPENEMQPEETFILRRDIRIARKALEKGDD